REFKSLNPAVQAELYRKYRLDLPMHQQFYHWFRDLVVHQDLGRSMKNRDKTVNEIIAQALPVSLALGSMALLVAVYLGLATGLVAGARQNTIWDYGSMSMAILGISLPSFVLAVL